MVKWINAIPVIFLSLRTSCIFSEPVIHWLTYIGIKPIQNLLYYQSIKFPVSNFFIWKVYWNFSNIFFFKALQFTNLLEFVSQILFDLIFCSTRMQPKNFMLLAIKMEVDFVLEISFSLCKCWFFKSMLYLFYIQCSI